MLALLAMNGNYWEQSADNVEKETDNISISLKVYPVKPYSSEDRTICTSGKGKISSKLNWENEDSKLFH